MKKKKLKIKVRGEGYIAVESTRIYTIVNKTGSWVATDEDGNFVDKDQYRYDLFDRLKIHYEKNDKKELCGDYPDKKAIIKLLNSQYFDGNPKWSPSDLKEVQKNLKLLTYLWFRVEL